MRLGLNPVAAAICRIDKPSSCADLMAHIRSSWASSNRRSAVRSRSMSPRSRWMRLRNSSRVSIGAMVRHAVQKTGQLKAVLGSIDPQHPSDTVQRAHCFVSDGRIIYVNLRADESPRLLLYCTSRSDLILTMQPTLALTTLTFRAEAFLALSKSDRTRRAHKSD